LRDSPRCAVTYAALGRGLSDYLAGRPPAAALVAVPAPRS